jgi:hypothetical protein
MRLLREYSVRLPWVTLVCALAMFMAQVAANAAKAAASTAAPSGFRSMAWDSQLPPAPVLKKSILKSCGRIVEKRDFNEGPACWHMYLNADHLDLYAEEGQIEPLFGINFTSQLLTWSRRRFWSGEVFLYNYAEGDLIQLRRALEAAYGPPSYEDELGRWIEWRWPGDHVIVRLHADPVPKPSVGSSRPPQTSISLLFSKVD